VRASHCRPLISQFVQHLSKTTARTTTTATTTTATSLAKSGLKTGNGREGSAAAVERRKHWSFLFHFSAKCCCPARLEGQTSRNGQRRKTTRLGSIVAFWSVVVVVVVVFSVRVCCRLKNACASPRDCVSLCRSACAPLRPVLSEASQNRAPVAPCILWPM